MTAHSSQLDKVLALADSSFDGEALIAVRKARQMLSRDGLNFSDLARAAQKPRINLPIGLLSGSHIQLLESEVSELRDEIERLRCEKIRNDVQVSVLKQRTQDLESRLGTSQADADRWRQLARDTVDKLWDLSKAIEQEEQTTTASLPQAKP